MKIILDFDDVLFNTKKFKIDYLDIFRKNGISKKIFEECYYDPSESEKNIKQYNPANHFKRICERIDEEKPELQRDINNFIKNTSRYIFQDVKDFLEKFRKEELCIVSFSITDFQKLKIDNSGIAESFQEIRIVNELKSGIIYELIKDKKIIIDSDIYFVDDRIEQIMDVKKKFPEIKTILLKRKEGRYDDKINKYCDFECESLKKLEKIIIK